MKLSAAIREGVKRGPQLFGRTFDGGGGSCAFGAAWGAFTGKWTMEEFCAEGHEILTNTYPELTKPATTPDGSHHHMLLEAILHMNDRLRMTREEIADWLDSQGF